MLSSPAIMRRSVDLPQPDGPTRITEIAVSDIDRHAVDDFVGAVGLADIDHADWRHLTLLVAHVIAFDGKV